MKSLRGVSTVGGQDHITEFAGSVQSYINRKPVSAMCNEELGYACGDERKVSKWKKMTA
jgi:hypothetical protein